MSVDILSGICKIHDLVSGYEHTKNNSPRVPVDVNMRISESEHLEPQPTACGGNFGGNNATYMHSTVIESAT